MAKDIDNFKGLGDFITETDAGGLSAPELDQNKDYTDLDKEDWNSVGVDDLDDDQEDDSDDSSGLNADDSNDNDSDDSNDLSEGLPELQNLYKILVDENSLRVDDDFKFDGTPEKFNEALDRTFDALVEDAQEALLSKVPEDVRDLLRYSLTTKKGINEYLESDSKVSAVEDLDLNDETNQERILYSYYKSTSNYPDSKINKLIRMSKDSGELDSDAREAKQELMELKAKNEEQREKQFRESIAKEKENEAKERQLYENLINQSKEINQLRKDKLRNFLVNKQRKSNDVGYSTEFSRALKTVSANPEHIVQLADLLLDYNPEKGFNLDRFAKKQTTNKTKEVLSRMDQVLDPQRKLRSSSEGRKSTSFEFEKWAMLSD